MSAPRFSNDFNFYVFCNWHAKPLLSSGLATLRRSVGGSNASAKRRSSNRRRSEADLAFHFLLLEFLPEFPNVILQQRLGGPRRRWECDGSLFRKVWGRSWWRFLVGRKRRTAEHFVDGG